MTRETFLYMPPKVPKEANQCSSCWKFTGKTCLEFSHKDVVKGSGSCNLYNAGKPHIELAGKETGGTTPYEAGYVEQKVTCGNCEFFESEDNDCLLFRTLNIYPYKVDKNGCCNAFMQEEKSENKVTKISKGGLASYL